MTENKLGRTIPVAESDLNSFTCRIEIMSVRENVHLTVVL